MRPGPNLRPLRSRWVLAWLVGLGGALAACGQTPSSPASMSAYHQLLKVLYKNQVPVVPPRQLAAELAAPAPPVLLDIRTPAEFQVSHLPGARLLDYATYQQVDMRTLPARHQPIVVYCSVGVRSERVGAWLKQQGFSQVRNLYGGLFEWVNEGYGVVDAHGPTTRVHPYSLAWRPWLRRGEPAYQ